MEPENKTNMEPEGKKERRHLSINIGMIVFFIILIYIVISVVINIGKENISVVEVQKGKIVDNGYYTGIILRSEELVTSNNSGYINFYVKNGGKVASEGNVYMINSAASGETGGDGNFTGFSASDYADMRKLISVYTANYSDSHYSDLYTFKYDLQNQITEAISNYNISDASRNTGNYTSIRSDKSGVVSYTYDGMEGLTREQITDAMFNSTDYEKQQLISNQWIDSGDVAYKLITDDLWSIIIKLTPAQAKSLSEKNRVTLRFVKDNIETTAGVEIFTNGESNYACLSLSKYMVRYIADRYIEMELIATSAEGLKIPTSAVLEKDFYKIPVDYLITDEESSESGFYKYTYDQDGQMSAVFYKAAIYENDGEFCYVDTDDFKLGDYIGKLNSDDRYRIGATGQLTGVYNINKGYSIFRLVKILYQNDEYCIVQTNTPYGISLYDRIILNADSVNENQLIY